MTIKQAAMWLCQPGIVSMIHDPTTKKALRVAVKALAEPELGTNLAEVGTDCISRQAAIDAVMECYDNDELFEVYEWKPNELPAIQPKRGKWIKISPANIYECSECGKNVMTDDISAYDFCHGCGAEMTEGEGCVNS